MKIAITGSIGSGKSLVSSYLREMGYPVYDTDKMVHHYYEPSGLAYHDLIATFGSGIVDDQGFINRKVLAELVFQDPALLKALEDIVYPHLKREILAVNASQKIVFFEVPVLFESGFEIYFDRILMIDTKPEIAFERLLARGMEPLDIKTRLKNQMAPSEKRQRSDFVIENNETQKALHDKLKVFMTHLKKEIAYDSI